MRKNYDIKTTQMNENFENLIYKKFWTEDVIKEWKEMIPNRYNILFFNFFKI